MPPPLAGGDLRFGVGQLAGLVDCTGNRERQVSTVLPAKRIDRNTNEFIDVANVVGEEDEVLEMLCRSAGVMLEAPG